MIHLLIQFLNLYYKLQEHVIRTGCGSVSVIVYGDQDKPALITYPDLALNCKFSWLRDNLCLPLLFSHVDLSIDNIHVIFCYQMCPVSKGCSFVPRQLPCFYITSAFTTLVLLDMRFGNIFRTLQHIIHFLLTFSCLLR